MKPHWRIVHSGDTSNLPWRVERKGRFFWYRVKTYIGGGFFSERRFATIDDATDYIRDRKIKEANRDENKNKVIYL